MNSKFKPVESERHSQQLKLKRSRKDRKSKHKSKANDNDFLDTEAVACLVRHLNYMMTCDINSLPIFIFISAYRHSRLAHHESDLVHVIAPGNCYALPSSVQG